MSEKMQEKIEVDKSIIGAVFGLLMALPQDSRATVLCWFCPGCGGYIPAGGKHDCEQPPADGER